MNFQGTREEGFKQNRLARMFVNEINWLKANFGPKSVTTEDYSKHDQRIYKHWFNKMEINKDRLLERLYRCGGEIDMTQFKMQNSQAGSTGGFSEFSEEKLKLRSEFFQTFLESAK